MQTPYLRRSMIDVYKNTYASLHIENPGENGKSELNVQRQPTNINDMGVNSEDIVFKLPQVVGRGYAYLGIWTSPVGGEFIQASPILNEQGEHVRRTANEGDLFVIPKGSFNILIKSEK